MKPTRHTPSAGIYMMQGVENRGEAWKETEMDIQGTFTGYQRMRHPKQENGAADQDGRRRSWAGR